MILPIFLVKSNKDILFENKIYSCRKLYAGSYFCFGHIGRGKDFALCNGKQYARLTQISLLNGKNRI